MKIKFVLLAMLIVLMAVISGCNDKSEVIGTFHRLEPNELDGMIVTPFVEEAVPKQFTQTESQDVYDYLLKIKSEESYILRKKDKGFTSLNYIIVLLVDEGLYHLNVGDDYILLSVNDPIKDPDNYTEERTVHMVTEDVIDEFEKLLDKLREEN